jgi:hypothetical protein
VNLRNKRFVISMLAVAAVLLFGVGVLAGYLSRNDKICPGGKTPVAQRSEVIGQTEYRCPGGLVVTK